MSKNPRYEEELERLQAFDEVLTICALRFDAETYLEQRAREHGEQFFGDFTPLVDPVMEESVFHEDDLDNLATFYALQRYLCKWGGEHLTPWNRQHIIFRQLFLHCYRLEIPEAFQLSNYYRQWEVEYRPRREMWAGRIRNTFRTIGDGPEVI